MTTPNPIPPEKTLAEAAEAFLAEWDTEEAVANGDVSVDLVEVVEQFRAALAATKQAAPDVPQAGPNVASTHAVCELALTACRLMLKRTSCEDIQHRGFGPAFDAAQKAVEAAKELAKLIPDVTGAVKC